MTTEQMQPNLDHNDFRDESDLWAAYHWLMSERGQLRAKNNELNRRAQQAEKAARDTLEKARRSDGSLGRSLANWAAQDALRQLEEASAALSAEREARGAVRAWQPIESAAKDGSAMLLYPCWIFGAVSPDIGYWDRDEDYEAWRTLDGERIEPPPTHWMPLPDAPA